MDSVRKGLRAGDIEKDTYDRLVCADCETQLGTENEPEEVHSLRICPDCDRAWKQL